MAENEANLQPESGQRRSPSYPVLTIDDAIERARRVYEADRRAFATFENVASNMGYGATKKGGRTGRAVAALKQYGLLEEKGGQYRISDTAFRILELPEDAPERARLVSEAALRPPIVRKILSHYAGQLPSDATLRSHLVIDEGFNPDSARDFIRVVRRTVELVNPSEADYNAPDAGGPKGQSEPAGATPMQQQQPATNAGEQFVPSNRVRFFTEDGRPLAGRRSTEIAIPLSRGSEAKVTIVGDATQEAIEKLVQYLKLSKDTFPTKDEIDQRENRRAATWHNKDYDQPVTVTGELGKGHDGRNYLKIAESQVGVPADEVEFEDAQAKGVA